MSRRRALLPPTVFLVAAGLSGCQQSPPAVTLRGAQHSVHADPTRWCPDRGKDCTSHRPAVPVLRIRDRADITVDVGATVAKRPWIVLVEGGSASPLQRGRTYRLVAVHAPVTVEVVTVDTDGSRVLQRDRWVFKVEPAQ